MEKKDTNAFEYSRTDTILINVILGGVIVGCILSHFFGLLQLPLPQIRSLIMGGIVLFSGLLIAAKWTLFWRKVYKGQLITRGISLIFLTLFSSSYSILLMNGEAEMAN